MTKRLFMPLHSPRAKRQDIVLKNLQEYGQWCCEGWICALASRFADDFAVLGL